MISIFYIYEFFMGIESNSFSLDSIPSDKEVMELEKKLSNGIFNAKICMTRNNLILSWKMNDAFIKLYIHLIFFFFLLFIFCSIFGVVTLNKNYLIVGFGGVFLSIFLNRFLVLMFRPWTGVINKTFAKLRSKK